jgi:S-adenosylmethionine-diacylglycerol 3-amino-3-carboxypropyl transferase
MSARDVTARLQKWEFESRIFISFGIVAATCGVSFVVFPGPRSIAALLGGLAGLPPHAAVSAGFLLSATIVAAASALRVWSGSILTSRRMMSFKVRIDVLLEIGPYRIVRNPIYLADLVAFTGFALCLSPSGAALPVLLFLHYTRIIRYEEDSLSRQFGEEYRAYLERIPRLLPDRRSLGCLGRARAEFAVSRDGLRHNALYLLFVPGFLLSAVTGELAWAVAVGLPAVIDWAIVHTRIGTARDPVRPSPEGGAGAVVFSRPAKVFRGVLYAQCWEDPQIDRQAFDLGPRDSLFSITSGGCNVLTFLVDNPGRVIALDLNPHQNQLLKLKMAAFACLSYPKVLEFLGCRESSSRFETYARLRKRLAEDARRFWDGRLSDIRRGVVHSGRYEGYMRLLGAVLVKLSGKRDLVRRFYEAEDTALREKMFREDWDDWSWKILTRLVLSRPLNVLLFDRSFYSYLGRDFSFGRHFAAKAERALVRLPMKGNYFLSYILGGIEGVALPLPVYLREENFELIRSRLDRVEVVTDTCEHFFSTLPDSSFSRFNFSNIFEWMSPPAFESLLRETVRVGRPGAILTYRNLLVFRERPESLADVLRPRRDISGALKARDLSFIYDNYVVEEICKGERL